MNSAISGNTQPSTGEAVLSSRGADDQLSLLGFSDSLGSLLRYLTLHPDERLYLRRLEQLYGAKSASHQRDLKRLVTLGALYRITSPEGARRVDYAIDQSWSLWPAIRSLVAQLSTPASLVREALRGVENIESAFVYGSQATGSARPDSDIDVFILGDRLVPKDLYRACANVAVLSGREVNPSSYTHIQLAERLGSGPSPSRRFLRDILSGPKEWVAGGVEALAPIAVAAGMAVEALANSSTRVAAT